MSAPRKKRSVPNQAWLSPYLLVALLSPAFFQTSSLSCKTGDTRLVELDVLVAGEDQIVFETNQRTYEATLTPDAESTLVRAIPMDAEARVWIKTSTAEGYVSAISGVVGGGEANITLQPGKNTLRVYVKATGGASDFYEVTLIRPGRWGEAVHVGGAGFGNANYPEIAMDATGRAVAVWSEDEGGGEYGGLFKIWASHYMPEVGWQAPERIGIDGPNSEGGAAVTMSSNGDAVVVWVSGPSQGDTSVWFNRYTSTEGWSLASSVSNSGNVTALDVASDAVGNAWAVWSENDGSGGDIRAAQYVAGEGWGIPGLIEPDDAGTAYGPQIAVSPNGDAVVVWVQHDGTRYGISSNLYVEGSGWGTAQNIDAGDTNALEPHVGLDDAGEAIAVWHQFDGQWSSAYANRYVPGEGWGAAELIEAEQGPGVRYTELSVQSNGNTVAVWTNGDMWANHFTPESGWGQAERIEAGEGSARLPHVAMDARGHAVAVWNQYTSKQSGLEVVWANHYVPGEGWSVPEIIAGGQVVFTYRPRVVVDQHGRALCVWDHKTDSIEPSAVWGNRFD